MKDSKAKLRGYQFRLHGKRQTVSFGRCGLAAANTAKSHIRNLLAAKRLGTSPQLETAEWLAKIDSKLHDRLAELGLVMPRAGSAPKADKTVRDYVEEFLARYAAKVQAGERKERTLLTMRNDAECLFRYLEARGSPKLTLAEFTADDADGFRTWMLAEKYSVATASRRVIRCREFFKAAVRSKLITENPFADTETGPQSNRSRSKFIDRATIAKLIEAAPNADWRALIALSRFGALRTPSETMGLKWADVDFVGNKITVHSPKTESHPGKDKRVIPLFPELRPYLEEAFDPDNVYVVGCFNGDTKANVRTQLLRIVKRAGLEKWERVTHNLRASRKNELAETFPDHVVSEWTGSSEKIDRDHYYSVRESDFERAVKSLPSGSIRLPQVPSETVNVRASDSPQVAEVAVFAENHRVYCDGWATPCQG